MKKEVIAVDLGGTHLRVAIVRNNKAVKYLRYKTPKKKEEITDMLFSSISSLIKECERLRGIGVASPGPIEKGVIKNTPNLPLKNFNLKKALEKRFKTKVIVENDATCVALAEAKLGCKKNNFFVLTLGTGIGGGIVINGEIYKGRGNAGELGHIILDKGKDFESLAAWKKTKKLTEKKFGKPLLISELAKMNNQDSKKILKEISMYLGQGIASLISVFDPEIVILAGGVSESGKSFLKMIKREAKKYAFLQRSAEIQWTKLKHPGILGASLLIE